MAAQKTIAIIGATGKMGGAIAKGLVNGPNRLLLFGNNQEKLSGLLSALKETKRDTDAEIIGCSVDASWEADIIIAAVPYAAEATLAEQIRAVATGKIVISISNPLSADFCRLVTEPGTSAGEQLQELLPHARVVKAFSTNFSAAFNHTDVSGYKLDAFIAGNDDEALLEVAELITEVGFNPVIAGDLTFSRTLENMTLLLINANIRHGYKGQAGWKILHN
ncbi:NADP oxidoreductase [Segetibacter sp. 3557_3]|uniref:NADPH-dependent F420 reductase n=1 Tax=Segetibacter sp. 3557_3 TaxID=2547429 RepID=UPI0010588D09|nr:NAD(P)-binding domain-containing protein [Segetibacter sp. 3557_3]TDH27316.1 NADP oxidoreductase [Segetibacter sp. 3557_3]